MADNSNIEGDNSFIRKNLLEINPYGTVLKPCLYVDQEIGQYKTIQSAIDAAECDTVIKVSQGLYLENLVIKKAGLKIEPKEKSGEVILLASMNSAIYIELDQNDKFTLEKIKIAHLGNQNDNIQLPEQLQFNYYNLQNQGFFELNDPENEFLYKFKPNENMNSLIYLKSGKLMLSDVLLSLNLLTKQTRTVSFGLILDENTDTIMNRSEIKGCKNFQTLGLICKYGTLFMKDCRIHNHKGGGVFIACNEDTNIKITDSKIMFNQVCGINIVGDEGAPLIEGNKIENNEGPGVRISITSKTKLIKNEFKLNQNGIEAISCEPIILYNKIEKNYKNGILTITSQNIRCDAKIKNNIICCNKENGIQCTGMNNFTRIEGNDHIEFNKRAGIRVDCSASVIIMKNTSISKNLGQGIVVVETSSALIDKNIIADNIKANIALGGQDSINTCIINNKIIGGRCEGIFAIEAGECWIYNNEIKENNDGIVLVTSIPDIRKNIIEKNKNNGVMIIKDSRPKLIENTITLNKNMGLYIRDKSHGTILQNVIQENLIELVVEKENRLLDNIEHDNNVNGDIRIPQNFKCNIF